MTDPDSGTEELQLPAEAPTDPRQALSLVPEDARTVTITNYTALRSANGFPGLDGRSSQRDREAFWNAARENSVLLAEGLLEPHDARLSDQYGFGRDDVTFELTFGGGGAQGYVLGLRPSLDLGGVRRAVRDGVGPLAGAQIRSQQHLVVSGTAAEGDPVWTDHEGLVHLTSAQDETTYLHRGCLPQDAVFAQVPDRARQRILTQHDPERLRPLEAFSISFSGPVATGRLGHERTDLSARTELAEAWPDAPGTSFSDGFTGLPLFDSSTGRVGLRVADPVAAAQVVDDQQLPFAVCAPD